MTSKQRRPARKLDPPPKTEASEAASSPSPADIAQIVIAASLVIWRVQLHASASLLSDWVVVVSAYWVFTILAGKARVWPAATIATMGYLLVIFAQGNLPKVLGMYEWLP